MVDSLFWVVWSREQRWWRVLGALLLALYACAVFAQEEQKPDAGNFYSGNVVEVDAQHVTVNRSVLGQAPETRTFQINASTKVEGQLRVKSRVTVQFNPTDDGDVAVHIIVRSGGAAARRYSGDAVMTFPLRNVSPGLPSSLQ